MASLECYACHALVREGMRSCAGCGAEQTRAALEAFRVRRTVRLQREKWHLLTGVVGLLAFALGSGLGVFAGQRVGSPSSGHASALSFDTQLPQITIEQANDGFMRSINDALRASEGGHVLEFGAISWVWGADSTLVLELARPTAEQPGLWHTLTAEQRYQVMGLLSVAYTRALISAGFRIDLANGHPPLSLQYRDIPRPLATRERDGNIRIFPSPFDQEARAHP